MEIPTILNKIITTLDDYTHLLSGALVALFIYREELKPYTLLSLFTYFFLSVIIGVYGGGFIAHYILKADVDNAKFIVAITTIFGLGIAGLIKEQAPAWLEALRKKWLGQ